MADDDGLTGRQTEIMRTWQCGDYQVTTAVDADGNAGFQVAMPHHLPSPLMSSRDSFGDTRTRMSYLAQTLMAARQKMRDDQFDLDMWPDGDVEAAEAHADSCPGCWGDSDDANCSWRPVGEGSHNYYGPDGDAEDDDSVR